MAASAATVTSASVASSPPPRGSRSVLPISARLSLGVGGGAGLSKPARRMAAFCSLDAPKDDIPIELVLAFANVMDINQIRDMLPHRFPFLLADRVIECSPEVSIAAIKNVTINDNFFPGHFPDRPIMPGVLVTESMAQVGGILVQSEIGRRNIFLFGGVDKVRFLKPVIAGDTLVMRMNLIKLQKRFGIAKMEGRAYVGGKVVCKGEFLLAFGGESSA